MSEIRIIDMYISTIRITDMYISRIRFSDVTPNSLWQRDY